MSKSLIKQQSLQGFIWNVLGSGGQQVFAFLIFIVLTRTLGAVEFGIMAMAAVFIDVLSLATRAGLTEVVVQRAKLSELDKNTAFWTSLLLGLVFTACLFAAAGPLAALLGVEGLKPILEWLSVLTLITALGTVHEGLLRKEFGFKVLALRSVVANCIGGIIAVVMALNGFGIMSLVMQRLISMIVLTAVMWATLEWRPRLEFSAALCREQLRMGTMLASANILSMGNQRVIDLVVGYVLGPVALGYLRIAWRGLDLLLEIGVRPITNVTLSTFSALQDNKAQMARAYVRLSQLTSLLAFPLFLGAGVVAPEFIVLLFGDQWQQSVVPMQILTLTVLTFPIIYFKNSALMAIGRAHDVLWLNVLEFVLSFAVVLVCAQFGLIGAALGNVLRVVLITPVILYVLNKHIELDVRLLLARTWPLMHAAAWMIAVLSLARIAMNGALHPVLAMAVLVPAGAVVYFAALWIFHKPSMLELWNSLAAERAKFAPVLRRFKLVK